MGARAVEAKCVGCICYKVGGAISRDASAIGRDLALRCDDARLDPDIVTPTLRLAPPDRERFPRAQSLERGGDTLREESVFVPRYRADQMRYAPNSKLVTTGPWDFMKIDYIFAAMSLALVVSGCSRPEPFNADKELAGTEMGELLRRMKANVAAVEPIEVVKAREAEIERRQAQLTREIHAGNAEHEAASARRDAAIQARQQTQQLTEQTRLLDEQNRTLQEQAHQRATQSYGFDSMMSDAERNARDSRQRLERLLEQADQAQAIDNAARTIADAIERQRK